MLTYHTEKYTPKALTTQATKAVKLNVTYDKHSRSWFPVGTTGFNRFPFNNFTYCLTFFSKFFSSFPHGTCSLSVSRRYLALGEIYLPFWAAIPNNSTLWERIVKRPRVNRTGFSPSMIPYPKGFGSTRTRKTLLQITTRLGRTCADLKFELFPLHSPLLRESLLFSFPPLIDMLKFSGYSYLIWGHLMKNYRRESWGWPNLISIRYQTFK
jgi:hypothetical protein